MMAYTISYGDICYLGNRSWHNRLSFVGHSWQLPNTALNNDSSCLCLHTLNRNHDIKEAFMCHSGPVLQHDRFNPWQCYISYFQCPPTSGKCQHHAVTYLNRENVLCTYSTIFKLSDREDLQPWWLSPPPQMKTFGIPTRKFCFPTIRGKTATCAVNIDAKHMGPWLRIHIMYITAYTQKPIYFYSTKTICATNHWRVAVGTTDYRLGPHLPSIVGTDCVSGSLSPRHGASSGCG